MKDGILILNKPGEWTSHDCVAICRRVLRLKGIKKIGHGGTLDPMAEGLLPIFIGQATRIMEYMDLDYKTYVCRARLGLATDTQDVWGQTLEEKPVEGSSEEDVIRALRDFEGIVEQVPPAYSAVRIDGKRLYEYARSGKAPVEDVPVRKVHIKHLETGEINLDEGTVQFSVECSKGTYVRTICHDLGVKLGTGCAMEALKRVAIGELDLSSAISPEKIKEMDPEEVSDIIEPLILPPDAPLKKFGVAFISKERAEYFRRGNSTVLGRVRIDKKPEIVPDARTGEIPLNARGRSYDRIYRVYEEGSKLFLGIGFEDREKGLLKADKVFAAKE